MAAAPRNRRPPKRPPRPTGRPAAPKAEKKRDSAPEIVVGYSRVGRETLAAITTDLLAPPQDPPRESGPELEFELVPAGRETLSAIAAEVAAQGPTGVRAPMTTLDYEQRPPEPRTAVRRRAPTRDYEDAASRMTNPGVAPPAARSAPGAPSRAPGEIPAPRSNARPAAEGPLGRDTLDAIANAVLEPGAPPSSVRARQLALEVYELVTFVIRGDDMAQLSTEATRREFVAERLMHRLPVSTLDQVDRIDVTPWTVRGTVILRVWCKVRPPMR